MPATPRTCEQVHPGQRCHCGPHDQVTNTCRKIYDIFEGTEQIQQLIIARAISGLPIK